MLKIWGGDRWGETGYHILSVPLTLLVTSNKHTNHHRTVRAVYFTPRLESSHRIAQKAKAQHNKSGNLARPFV